MRYEKLPFINPVFYSCLYFFTSRIGFSSWVNMSELDYEELQNKPLEVASYNGIQVSMVNNFRIGGIFSIQPELVFSQKGYRYKEDAPEYNTFVSNYLELPVMMEVGIPLGNSVQLFADLGPNVSYLLSAREKVFDLHTNQFSTQEVDFSLRDELERLDFGVNLGGGFSFRFRRSKITFDARYNIGFNDIMEVDSPQAAFELAKNRVTNFAIGYSYILLGKFD